ncbi:MAG: hypothetical protein IBJ18_01610 [Phycisphaerales bacterium]|nr:hypothetical protein [Phycisphaerales bacterium]
MKRRTAIVGVVAGVLSVGAFFSGCARSQPEPRRAGVTVGEPKLKLCVWRAEDEWRPKHPRNGVIFAVWDDGRVLYSPDWDLPKDGRVYLTGELEESVEDFLRRCVENEHIFRGEGWFHLVPGGGMGVTVGIDRGENRSFRAAGWDERLTAGYGLAANPTETEREFVKSWYSFRFSLAATALKDTRPIEPKDGEDFRGIPLWSGTIMEWSSRNIRR